MRIWLLSILLAANLLLLAWGQGWLGGSPGSAQREPARLDLQLQPDALQWVPASEASRFAKALPQCREVGPLPDAAAQARVAARLSAMGVPALEGWVLSTPGEWAVATRPSEDEAELARKRQVLVRAGLSVLKAEKLLAEGDPSWVVSRHPQRSAGVAELNRLRESRGLRALRLVTLREPAQAAWVRSADWPRAQAQVRDALWPAEPRACAKLGPEVALLPISPPAAASAASGAVVSAVAASGPAPAASR